MDVRQLSEFTYPHNSILYSLYIVISSAVNGLKE